MARALRPRNLPLRRLSTALEQPAAAEMSIADLAPSLHRLKSCPSQTLTLETTTTLRAAAQHLVDNRLTFAMVLDEDRTVAGVLTERDLLRFATRLGDLQFFRPSTTEHRTSEWMTPLSEMLSVRLDHSLAHALAMTESGIWRQLPVLDYWDKLHSILDIRDVVEHVCDGIPGWKGKSVSDILSAKRLDRVIDDAVADPASTWPRQLERYLLSNAGRHMVPTSATIESAAKQIQKEKLTFLVVVRMPSQTRIARHCRATPLTHALILLIFSIRADTRGERMVLQEAAPGRPGRGSRHRAILPALHRVQERSAEITPR